MSPPKIRLRDLPEFLRKRIKIDAGREDKACWLWTGKVRAARERCRRYASNSEHPELREHDSRYVTEAAVPKVRHPITGKEEDARRHVYAAATMTPVCDVPTLQRCQDPRCVNPHHVVPGAPTAAQRKRLEARPEPETEAPPEAETLTDDEVTAILKSKRPLPEAQPGYMPVVEEECGLPTGSLMWPLWVEYCRWAIDNPEDDDD